LNFVAIFGAGFVYFIYSIAKRYSSPIPVNIYDMTPDL